MDKKHIDKIINSISKYLDYTEKRLAIHESAHVVLAYICGGSCQYMQSGLQRNVGLRNSNIEIDINSISRTYVNLSPLLESVLNYFTAGLSLNQIAGASVSAKNEISLEVKKYILGLMSGRIAERLYYDSIWHWQLKQIPGKYSIDLTPLDFGHDETKIKFLSSKIGLSSSDKTRFKRIVKKILKTKIVKNTCSELATNCLTKSRINQSEIEAILSRNGFNDVETHLSNYVLAQL